MPYKPPRSAQQRINQLLPAYYPLPTDYRNHGVVLSPRTKFFTVAHIAILIANRFRWIKIVSFTSWHTPRATYPHVFIDRMGTLSNGPSWTRTKDRSVMSRLLLPSELKVQIADYNGHVSMV